MTTLKKGLTTILTPKRFRISRVEKEDGSKDNLFNGATSYVRVDLALGGFEVLTFKVPLSKWSLAITGEQDWVLLEDDQEGAEGCH
jgi:hypothetical protein